MAVLATGTLFAACSGGDGSGAGSSSSTSAAPDQPTVPLEVEPGRGFLVVGPRSFVFDDVRCDFTAVTDPATGLTTDLVVEASDRTGVLLTLTRSTFVAGTTASTTETVDVDIDGEVLAQAQRGETGGRYVDLRVPDATGPLIEVRGTVVLADGVFGAPGGRPGPSDAPGSLIIGCP